jgi:imidazolonepropionase-like amidohydrolase
MTKADDKHAHGVSWWMIPLGVVFLCCGVPGGLANDSSFVAKKKKACATCSTEDNSSGGAPGASRGGSIVLRGGWIVDPAKQTVDQHDLYICAGVVVAAADGEKCSPKEVDVSGKFLIPGLNDMHMHARGISLGDYTEHSMTVDAVAATLRIAGVTSFLDSMNDELTILPIRDAQRSRGAFPGADIFAAGAALTPTGGHGTEYDLPKTCYRLVDTIEQAKAQVADIATKNPDFVKIMYDHMGDNGGTIADGETGIDGVAMKLEVMQAIVAECKARGLKTQVHATVWSDYRAAISAGVTLVAHMGEAPIPDDIVQMAARSGVYWVPTLSLFHGFVDIIADQSLLDDPLLHKVASPADIESYRPNRIYKDAETMAWFARHVNDKQNVAKLNRAGVKLLAGSDTIEQGIFIGWSLHRELKLLVDAGLSPFEALASATTTAGEFLGHDFGIEPGAEGNVVVLNASPIDDIWNTTKIDSVVHHGVVVPSPSPGDP